MKESPSQGFLSFMITLFTNSIAELANKPTYLFLIDACRFRHFFGAVTVMPFHHP
jgi:hypothetical protein